MRALLLRAHRGLAGFHPDQGIRRQRRDAMRMRSRRSAFGNAAMAPERRELRAISDNGQLKLATPEDVKPRNQ